MDNSLKSKAAALALVVGMAGPATAAPQAMPEESPAQSPQSTTLLMSVRAPEPTMMVFKAKDAAVVADKLLAMREASFDGGKYLFSSKNIEVAKLFKASSTGASGDFGPQVGSCFVKEESTADVLLGKFLKASTGQPSRKTEAATLECQLEGSASATRTFDSAQRETWRNPIILKPF